MTAADFRRIALSMPDTAEGSHMGHPDFRVMGKIFATLIAVDGKTCGMVKLKPDQQRQFIKSHKTMFEPVKGGWGRQGATLVHLSTAKAVALKSAILTAWLNNAPKQLVENWDSPRKVTRAAKRR